MDLQRVIRPGISGDFSEDFHRMKRTVLAIVPARGGSKGIKDKNIVNLRGKPLIAYTLDAARNSGVIMDLVVSTDSEDIASCVESLGVSVPNLRPSHLATDTAGTAEVIAYELETFERETGRKVDELILLQPTAPLRTGSDIRVAYETFRQSKADSLISCCNAAHVHPRYLYVQKDGFLEPWLDTGPQIVRRQDMEKLYLRNGAIYIVESEYFKRTGRLVAERPALYLMPVERSVNIDTDYDLRLAEFLLENGK